MTVGSIYTPVSYATDGSTSSFAVPFPFFTPADLVLTLYNPATQIVTACVLNGGGAYGFTVTGTPDEYTSEYPNGTVVFGNAAPPASLRLVIGRSVAETQNTELLPTTQLPAQDLEAGYDRLTMAVQELTALIATCIRAPAQDISPGMLLPAAELRGYPTPGPAVLTFDTSGNVALNNGLIGAQGPAGPSGGIDSANMLTWLQTLPTTPQVSAGWWNNSGVPNYS